MIQGAVYLGRLDNSLNELLVNMYLDKMNENTRNYKAGVINKKGFDVLQEHYKNTLKGLKNGDIRQAEK